MFPSDFWRQNGILEIGWDWRYQPMPETFDYYWRKTTGDAGGNGQVAGQDDTAQTSQDKRPGAAAIDPQKPVQADLFQPAPGVAPARPPFGDSPVQIPFEGDPAPPPTAGRSGPARRSFFGGLPNIPPETIKNQSEKVPEAAPRESGQASTIPTLHQDQPANEYDRTSYPPDSPTAKLYRDSKDSIVRILGTSESRDSWKSALPRWGGSGFFVSEDGKIITAYHVVENGNPIKVKTSAGKTFLATVKKVDRANDLALLKVNGGPGHHFKPLPLGKQDLSENDQFFLLGHPNGWEKLFVSSGQLLGTQSKYEIRSEALWDTITKPERKEHYLKLHCEQGNSGGPLLAKDGTVVGVLTGGSQYEANGTLSTGRTTRDIQALLGNSQESASGWSTLAHSVAHAGNTYGRINMLRNGKAGRIGSAFSIGLGAYDLVTNDFGNFKRALSGGSTGQMVHSGLQLGADALLVGGGIAGLSSRYRVVGGIASIGGSAIKLVSNALGY